VPAVPVQAIADAQPTSLVGERVCGARMNAELRGSAVGTFCALDGDGRALLRRAIERFGLSARGHDRVLKVARTIADLAGSDALRADHVAEALQYRDPNLNNSRVSEFH